MSKSPDRSRLAAELSSSRLPYESPTRYDSDFYLRKINRLENDMNVLQDELSGARVRLRRAEDFELKYEVSVRQNQQLQLQNERLTKEIGTLHAQIDRLRIQMHQANSKGEHPDVQTLRKEARHWQQRYQQSQKDCIEKLASLRNLNINSSKDTMKELESIRREGAERAQRYESQIRQLNRLVEERDTVDKFVGAKVERLKQQKDKEIERLSKIIDRQKTELDQLGAQKDQHTQKLKQRYQKIINLEIQHIQQNLSNQDEVFNIEMKNFKSLFQVKNDQIDGLLRRLQRHSEQSEREKDNMKNQIKSLTEALYKAQRQAQLQLYNIKQRLTSIHSEDLKNLQHKYQNHVTILKQNKQELQKLLGIKEQQLRQKEKDMDRQNQAHRDTIQAKDQEIKELSHKHNYAGQSNHKEFQNLHQSLHNIASEKTESAAIYAENMAFLDQQIKRLTTTLELRNIEIKNLQKNLSDQRKRADERIREAEQRWKNERKEREQERERMRQEMQALEEQHRQKQNAWRLKEKAYQAIKEKDGVQIDRLNCLVTELEKDVNRLNHYIKQLDDLLKKETRKNQIISLDTGGVRRELTSELDRQQSQMETIRKMQLQQQRKKYELEVQKLQNDNRRLKAQLLQKTLSYENLEQQFKKMQSNNKILERINKQKLIEYQKKMAALNSQIFLTQNIYQSFMEAKSKIKRERPG